MTTINGITFLKSINAEGDKPVSYQMHSCIHKKNVYDISSEKGFSFIGLSWMLDTKYFLNMKGNQDKCILCLDSKKQIPGVIEKNIPFIVCPLAVFSPVKPFKYEQSVKVYDAIINCRNSLWKRRHLAEAIDSLAVIYYRSPSSSAPDNLMFYNAYKPNIVNGVYNKLKPDEINKVLNQCKVGLVLSKQEGSPRAVVEYLLCGLPVVSTKANCGRWEFLDDTNSITVDDNKESVAEGVKRAIEYLENGRFNPFEISRKTKDKIVNFRKDAEEVAGVKLIWE